MTNKTNKTNKTNNNNNDNEIFNLHSLNKFSRLVDSYDTATNNSNNVGMNGEGAGENENKNFVSRPISENELEIVTRAGVASVQGEGTREAYLLPDDLIESLQIKQPHKAAALANSSTGGTKTVELDDPEEELSGIDDLIYKYHRGMIDAADKLKLERMVEPKMTKYNPHVPTAKQAAFLLLTNREAFYGGAAGGGKSDALLMAALQYVDIPGYRAILFRKTYADLSLPGALMDRMKEWLAPFREGSNAEVRWVDKEKTYVFPSGATVTFGYLEHDSDKYRYQGAEFQFIGFDELTHINLNAYRYMFSRLRRLKGSKIPLRVRGASNPGGMGHEWVKLRFLIEGPEKRRVFIPAGIDDNPYLDAEEYRESLAELDPITREQLMNGNWDVKTDHGIFDRDWFPMIDEIPTGHWKSVRYWDLAATEVKKGKDPDWTVGLKLLEQNGIYIIEDIRRKRARPHVVEQLIQSTALMDGKRTHIYMEQEPGASGVNTIDHYSRNILKGFVFKGHRNTGSKVERAAPASSAAEQGRIYVLRRAWNSEFFDEIEAFPMVTHDDQVDGFSGAFNKVSNKTNIYALPIGAGEQQSYWGGI